MDQERTPITISSLAYGGEAVGRVGGKVVFVPFGAPGDLATVAITEDHGRFARARLLSIEHASQSRRAPRCAYFTRCGGCTWQHVSYAAQLAAKEEALRDAFRRIARIEAPFLPIVPSSREFGYRSRTRIQVGGDGAVGYFAASSDEIVDVDTCPILEPALDAELRRLRESLSAPGVRGAASAVDAAEDAAHRAHGAAGAARETGRTAASARGSRASKGRELELELDDEGKVRSAWRTTRADGALGFRQANRSVNERLRAFIRERAAVSGEPSGASAAPAPEGASAARAPGSAVRANAAPLTVIDLFCGNGNLSLPLARDGARVIGIDSSPGSIAAARAAAERFDADYRCDDAAKMSRTLRALARGADCLIIDPPRKGLGRLAVELARLAIPRVLYVSCAPPTLARDARVFVEHGYAVCEVQPFDMFPQSYHVESVAVLARS